MRYKAIFYKNRVKILIILVFLILGLAFLLTINRSRKNSRITRAVAPLQHHQGEVQDVMILSLSEQTARGSRFKLRVTTLPDFALLPISVALTKANSEKVELLLQKSDGPYVCTDTHDYNKDRIGYETQWFNGNLENYLAADIEVLLRSAGNSLTIAAKGLTHSCSIFSEDIGEANITGDVDPLPYTD